MAASTPVMSAPTVQEVLTRPTIAHVIDGMNELIPNVPATAVNLQTLFGALDVHGLHIGQHHTDRCVRFEVASYSMLPVIDISRKWSHVD